MGNFLPPGKVIEIQEHIEKGKSIRETMEETGVAKQTIMKIRKAVVEMADEKGTPILCECGKPAGHNGWCKERLAKKPARKEFLEGQSGKFKPTSEKPVKTSTETFWDRVDEELGITNDKIEKLESKIKAQIHELWKLQTIVSGLEECLTGKEEADNMTPNFAFDTYITVQNEALQSQWESEKEAERKKKDLLS